MTFTKYYKLALGVLVCAWLGLLIWSISQAVSSYNGSCTVWYGEPPASCLFTSYYLSTLTFKDISGFILLFIVIVVLFVLAPVATRSDRPPSKPPSTSL
jgi:hypothetical protein